MQTVKLDLQEKSYDIIIGQDVLKKANNFIKKQNYSKIIILADENALKFHQNILEDNFNFDYEIIAIKSGEKSKSFENLEKIANQILEKSIDRKSALIAFGGGVVGDFCGFLASILLRGIDFIQVPTTLLSMVDSSVGGKTAINSRYGKNLIGAFYQPKLVLIDLNFLYSLESRQFLSGYAEIIKYGLIWDKEFFEYLDISKQAIIAKDKKVLEYIITKSCQIKAEIVSRDEKESSVRALLNFGHTFGHTLEVATNYSDELYHGEAVAIGMVMAATLSQNKGYITKTDLNKIKNHLTLIGLKTNISQVSESWDASQLIEAVKKDKKNTHGNLKFILLNEIGKAYIDRAITLKDFQKIIEENLQNN